MDRVRVRANSYFCGSHVNTVGRGGRTFNYTVDLTGNLIEIKGTNFQITNCDIYAAWNVIWTASPGGSYGFIANNTIYNGGAAHWFDQMK